VTPCCPAAGIGGCPVLSGVTKTPFLRRDGSVCETPGYDVTKDGLCRPSSTKRQRVPRILAARTPLAAAPVNHVDAEMPQGLRSRRASGLLRLSKPTEAASLRRHTRFNFSIFLDETAFPCSFQRIAYSRGRFH
jgi:hypothetical protein